MTGTSGVRHETVNDDEALEPRVHLVMSRPDLDHADVSIDRYSPEVRWGTMQRAARVDASARGGV